MMHKTIVQLHHRDCVAGMAELPEKSVDLCVTSPPYNLGINYGVYRDDRERDDYLAWTRTWAKALFRVLSDEGSLFLNVRGTPSEPMARW